MIIGGFCSQTANSDTKFDITNCLYRLTQHMGLIRLAPQKGRYIQHVIVQFTTQAIA